MRYANAIQIMFGLLFCINPALASTDLGADRVPYYGYGDCTEHAIYMGCDVQIDTAANGAIGNMSLIQQRQRLAPAVHTVIDKPGEHVWSLVGWGLANATVIETDEGLIVVDTGEDVDNAQQHIEQIRQLSDKPVKAIIYTHWHYAEGTKAYQKAWPDTDIEIWGHEDLHRLKTEQDSSLAPAMLRRLWRHFGLDLPQAGPDSMIVAGVGRNFLDLSHGLPESGYVRPEQLVSGEGESHKIAGATVKFFNHAADTTDTLLLWMPERDLVVNNHLTGVLTNLYSLRGGRFRDPSEWIAGLDHIRQLRPGFIANTHGLPLRGEKEVYRAATYTRDAIQFIYDHTIQGINKGLHVEAIVESLRLPEPLREASVNRPNYGEFAHHIRGIYYGLEGWFAEDAVEINPLPRRERAQRVIEGFGGVEATQEMAVEALDDQAFQWAAELTQWLLLDNPDNNAAKEMQAKALRAMGQRTPAATSRHFYLTQALHQEGQIDMFKPSLIGELFTSERFAATPPGSLVRSLRFNLQPDADTNEFVFAVRFTDLNKTFGLRLRNGIGEFVSEMPDSPDLLLESPRRLWLQVMSGEVEFEEALRDEMKIAVGGEEEVMDFLSRVSI